MVNIEIVIDGESSPIIYVEKEKDYINIEKVLFILQKERNIETTSVGLDKERHVVVKYKR